MIQTLKNVSPVNIGKKPMVVLPLAIWREIENKLEDFEMMNSFAFRQKIAKARAEKKKYTPLEVRKLLKIQRPLAE